MMGEKPAAKHNREGRVHTPDALALFFRSNWHIGHVASEDRLRLAIQHTDHLACGDRSRLRWCNRGAVSCGEQPCGVITTRRSTPPREDQEPRWMPIYLQPAAPVQMLVYRTWTKFFKLFEGSKAGLIPHGRPTWQVGSDVVATNAQSTCFTLCSG